MPTSASTASSQDRDAIPSDIPADVLTKSNTVTSKSTYENTTDDTTITSLSKDIAVDEAVMMETDDEFKVDEFGLPLLVNHTVIQGRYVTVAVFVYFRELARHDERTYQLDSKLTNAFTKESSKPSDHKVSRGTKTPPKSKTKSSSKSFFSKKFETKKTYNSVCLLCLRNIQALKELPRDAWIHALCNVLGNSANTEKHLHLKHADEQETIMYFQKKEERKEMEHARGLDHPTALHGHFTKSRLSVLREKMINWIISCGIPHEVTQLDEFIAMFRVYAMAVSCETLIEGMEKRFEGVSFSLICFPSISLL